MTDITQEILALREKYVGQGTATVNKTHVARTTRNATVIMESGEEFIDFVGGVGVMNFGHNHPKVVEAIKNQIDKAIHPGYTAIQHADHARLAKALCELTAGDHEKKIVFFNTGAEAVENAVKIARAYTGRRGVLTFFGGFHGRTNLALSMTTRASYKVGGAFASDIYRAPFPYMFRKPEQLSDDEYIDSVIAQFDNLVNSSLRIDDLACVVMEPIQGEGGFIVPPQRFVEHVYQFCQANNILFIADEIQAGFCRTGKNFGMENYGIIPDLMTMSKSIGAGIPLSAVQGRKEIIDFLKPGELGGTYSGNALACAAGLAIVDIIHDENINQKSLKLGEEFKRRLEALQKKYPLMADIRGIGSMLAVEFVKDLKTKEPDAKTVDKIITYCNENGLLINNAGMENNVIRFLAPLTTTEEEMTKGFSLLEKAIANAYR